MPPQELKMTEEQLRAIYDAGYVDSHIRGLWAVFEAGRSSGTTLAPTPADPTIQPELPFQDTAPQNG
jgi:acyl transferase domain-containing protein